MLDWTDRHERFFLRLLSQHALLYTEMVTTGALLHGDRARHLDFSPEEHPVALQLGGSEPDDMARCAELAQQWGYDEVNINVGCPSDRVQSGSFGACLMAEPERVAACVKSMQAACDIPVTVKSRIGIDEHESEAFLHHFIETVANGGCDTFVVHARIAILAGLSPKENRDIPPLQYERVHRLKQRYPELKISLNGGIKSLSECQAQLAHVDGVMMGREAYQNPYILATVDRDIFDASSPLPSRHEVMAKYLTYVAQQLSQGSALQHMTRHILGLYKGQPGGRLFRRHLSENAHRKGADISVLEDAVALAEAAIARSEQQTILNAPERAPQTGMQHV